MTVTRRVSKRPIDQERLLQAVNKEIVPAVAELIENANAQDVAVDARLDAAETMLVDHDALLDELIEPPFEADYGDGVATVFNFVHNFGTYAVVATSWDNATRTVQALATESMPDVNTYRITLGAPPAASALHVAIGRLRG